MKNVVVFEEGGRLFVRSFAGDFSEADVAGSLPPDTRFVVVDAATLPDAPQELWRFNDQGSIVVLPAPAPDPAVVRAGMVCSRLQGRLVLGPDTCAQLDAIAASPDTPWAMRETIQNAMEWRRTSEAMTELGYLLGYDDDQMDALFVQAMGVSV